MSLSIYWQPDLAQTAGCECLRFSPGTYRSGFLCLIIVLLQITIKVIKLYVLDIKRCKQAEFELESFTFQQIQRKGILPNLLVLMQTTIAHWMFLGKKNFPDTISISYWYYWYMHIEMLVHRPAKKIINLISLIPFACVWHCYPLTVCKRYRIWCHPKLIFYSEFATYLGKWAGGRSTLHSRSFLLKFFRG